MTAFLRACTAFGRAMTVISVAVVLLLALPIAYDVTMRFFGRPTLWVFEISMYALITAGFLANAVALRSGAHFRVTVLMKLFPRWRRALNLFSLSVTLIFALILTAAGCYYVWYSWTNAIVSATLLEVPLWIPELALPLGGLALFLETLVMLVTGAEPSEDVPGGD